MLNNLHEEIGALGPRFALPLEAVSVIRDKRGDVAMIEHALAYPAEDATVRIVALALSDATLALNVMAELVRAQASGNPAKVARVRKRLDKVLAAAKARALATCNS